MDLISAVAGNQGVQSVVALCESELFRRGHASVGRVIAALRPRGGDQKEIREAAERRLRRPIAPLLERPAEGEPWLLSVDVTPMARPHAETLSDRGFVHQSQAVPGQKPVTIGHEYSLAMVLPERGPGEPVWALPLAARRVPTSGTAASVASEQIIALVTDPLLPMAGSLTVVVADSHYSQPDFIGPLARQPDVVSLTRLRKNRVLFLPPQAAAAGVGGRPRRYGAKLRPGDAESLDQASETLELTVVIGGEDRRAMIYRWNDLILRSEQAGRTVLHVADVVLVTVFGPDGRPCYRHDLTLALVGDRRREISTNAAYAHYRRRFDQEHSHRVLRRNLHIGRFQTPVTEHEEAWVDLVVLAFQTLFAARHLVHSVRRPWEPKPKAETDKARPVTPGLRPSQVQRGIARVFAEFGTPARPAKPRGIPPGWKSGTPRRRRDAQPLVKRGPPVPPRQDKAA